MEDRIKIAGFGKRLGAYLIDGAFVLVTYFVLMNFWGLKGLATNMGYTQDTIDVNSLKKESHLFEEVNSTIQVVGTAELSSASSSSTTSTAPVYKTYLKSVREFYVSFMGGDGVDNPKVDGVTKDGVTTSPSKYYTVAYFNQTVMGLPNPAAITDVTDETKISSTSASSYYKYALNAAGDAVDPNALPVLKNEFQTAVDGSDATAKSSAITSLNKYWYNTSASTGVLVDAANRLSTQSYYSSRVVHANYASWAIEVVCFLPMQLLVFLLIPLLSKNGQTPGKWILQLGVLNKDGYSITPYNRIMRPSLVTLLGCLYVIVPPISILPYAAYGIMALIDYIVMAATKDGTNRAIHDRLAKTIVVDSKKSLWFASPEAEDDYYSKNPVTEATDGSSLLSPEESARIDRENSVLDMSTINKHRDEAASMTSFDEFEAKTLASEPNAEERAHTEGLSNLAKSEGKGKVVAPVAPVSPVTGSIEEPEEKKEEKKDKPYVPPDEEGFTDEALEALTKSKEAEAPKEDSSSEEKTKKD